MKNIPREYKSALDVAWKMYCREGITSFYTGLAPALLGVTHLVVQFPLYEKFKRYFTGSGLGDWHEDQGWRQILGILMASSMSKACATVATYPHEVIRTRLQTQQQIQALAPICSAGQRKHGRLSVSGSGSRRVTRCTRGRSPQKAPFPYRGVLNTLATVWREEGWRALYSGMGTSLIGAIPASITTMLVYETAMRLIKESRTQGNRKLGLRGADELE